MFQMIIMRKLSLAKCFLFIELCTFFLWVEPDFILKTGSDKISYWLGRYSFLQGFIMSKNALKLTICVDLSYSSCQACNTLVWSFPHVFSYILLEDDDNLFPITPGGALNVGKERQTTPQSWLESDKLLNSRSLFLL